MKQFFAEIFAYSKYALIRYAVSLLAGILLLFAQPAAAVLLTGEFVDQQGQPVVNAVISALPIDKVLPVTKPGSVIAALDQRNREFVPHVLAVRTGTLVNFPNHDAIRHHVYSFSPAKRFEIKLYKDSLPAPIVFDTPGVVVLGCNIHDWMLSYVYVTDAPYVTQTDNNGHWQLDLPVATYQIKVWHPYQHKNQSVADETYQITEQQASHLQHILAIMPTNHNGKPPESLQAEVYKGEP